MISLKNIASKPTMENPDIENIWEMAISLGPNITWTDYIKQLKNLVIPAITVLKKNCGVRWYCFLFHNNDNGIPLKGRGLQVHIRFENSNKLSLENLTNYLPAYCEMIRKSTENLNSISGINKPLLKNEDISEAWKILGESCEWIINLINAHRLENDENINELQYQVSQFQHFIKNITWIGFY